MVAIGLMHPIAAAPAQIPQAEVDANTLQTKVALLRDALGPDGTQALDRILECPGAASASDLQLIANQHQYRDARQCAALLERRSIFRDVPKADAEAQSTMYRLIGTDARFALWTLQATGLARLELGYCDDAVSVAGMAARIAERQGNARTWASLSITPQAALNALRISRLMIDRGVLTPELAERLRAAIAPLRKPDPAWQIDQQVDLIAFRLRAAREMVQSNGVGARDRYERILGADALAAADEIGNENTWRATVGLVDQVKARLGHARIEGHMWSVAGELAAEARTKKNCGKWAESLAGALDAGCQDARKLQDMVDEVDATLTSLADRETNEAAKDKNSNALYRYRDAAQLIRQNPPAQSPEHKAALEASARAAFTSRFDPAMARCDACFARFLPPDLVDRFVVGEWLIRQLPKKGSTEADTERERLSAAIQAIVVHCRADGSVAGEIVAARLEGMSRLMGFKTGRPNAPGFELTATARRSGMECCLALFEDPDGDSTDQRWLTAASDARLIFTVLVADAWFAIKYSRHSSWDAPEAEALRHVLCLDAIHAPMAGLAMTLQTPEGKHGIGRQFESVDLADWWRRLNAAIGGIGSESGGVADPK